MTTSGYLLRGVAAPYALPITFAAYLAVGTSAAALHGRFSVTGVLVASAVIAGLMAFITQPLAAPLIAGIGWLTVVGFSRPPYAQLRLAGGVGRDAALTLAVTVLVCAGLGWLFRWYAQRLTLVSMGRKSRAETGPADAVIGPDDPPGGISRRRRAAGGLLGLVVLPLLTVLLTAGREHLNLADEVLAYLVAVVAITVIGGFWPAVLAAVAASLLLNWYFTAPLHTFTIQQPPELLALLLFVTVAVAVSSVVHLAARRAVQAELARAEAASLLELAQTVLGGSDTPAAVLDHLTRSLGGQAELIERVAGRWIRAASSSADGGLDDGADGADAGLAAASRIDIRADLALRVTGQNVPASSALIAGFAAQAAAALDRERLRTQAAQAEALAEGNRMRTALLAAVSHDLRTPLASIKASVSSLRQTDVAWSAADQADLLATIEQNADRLDALIGNLLDMSRLHTGSLRPFLRPIAIDEVAPAALHGLEPAAPNGLEPAAHGLEPAAHGLDEQRGPRLLIAVPDGFPLVRADPGLLERVLANLFSNAVRHSPPSRPPELRARLLGPGTTSGTTSGTISGTTSGADCGPDAGTDAGSGGMVALEVVDYGRGVPDDDKERIFEPFVRVGDRLPGIGLGLAVAKGFAEAMGGSIDAVDTPGGGLTVRVLLPVVSEDRTALGASS